MNKQAVLNIIQTHIRVNSSNAALVAVLMKIQGEILKLKG